MPIFLLVNAQPGEAYPESNHGKSNKDVRTPGAEVCEGSEDEEDDNLKSEADAIGQQYDTVDGPAFAHEDQHLRISRRLIHEVLKGRRAEVEERETIVTNIIPVKEC